MSPLVPKIGFDRFIHLDWITAALKVSAGIASIEDLTNLFDMYGLSVEAQKKTRTILNRLWLKPRLELSDFASRGIELFKANPDEITIALCWGTAIANYPFFGKVAELTGRLSALQGDCTAAEVHRRMSEIYGEREGTSRMTSMVLQSQASWNVIERTENYKRIVRRAPKTLTNELAIAWLVEAALRYTGKAISVSSLQSMNVLYPFKLDQPLAYIVSKSPNLELRSEGSGIQFVGLRETI